jgi:hypothetical protein
VSGRRWGRRRKQAFLERLFEEVVGLVTGMMALTWRGGMSSRGEDAELHVYECVTELVGGPSDGAEVFHGFAVDMKGLVGLLNNGPLGCEPPEFGFNCDVGFGGLMATPYVYVEGWFEGVPIVVYVHGRPLDGEEPSWLCYQDGSMRPKGVPDEEEKA